MSADKQQEIDELEREIFQLTSRNSRLANSNEELRETIQNKTQEILKLRSELNKILTEYDRILLNMAQLRSDNEELKILTNEINRDRAELFQNLSQANEQIQSLTDSLANMKFTSELQEAEINNLTEELNRILDKRVWFKFVEVLPYINSPRLSLQYGRVSSKNDLLWSIKAGYHYLKRDPDTELPVEMGILPVSLQLTAPIRSKLRFESKYRTKK